MAYDKVIDSAKLDADMTTVADAIRSKGGTSEALAFPAGFVSAIEAIEAGGGGGGGEVTPPTTPTDGKTRVYIHLEYGRTSPMLGVCPKGTVTVDWGDGTKPDTLTGTSTTTVKWTPTHEYTAPGDYVIALTVEGTMGFYGNSSGNQYSGILRYASGADTRNFAYQNAVQKVEIGEGVTSIGSYAFSNCYSLASITIPEGVTSIDSHAFSDCYSLASITIPENVTSIGSYAFSNCYPLASVVIPESVKSIGYTAFGSCYGVRYYDFTKHTAVPTLLSSNAFNKIAEDCEIRVPAALYDEWIAATNWTTLASYIKAV